MPYMTYFPTVMAQYSYLCWKCC